MVWNWQLKGWPNFTYDTSSLKTFEEDLLHRSGLLFGAFKHLTDDDKNLLKIEIISGEAVKTSEIEGEYLDRDSIQSSIRRQFGLQSDGRKIPPAEKGIAEMLVDLYRTYQKMLKHEDLYRWHRMLMQGRSDMKEVGCYRSGREKMQVVSGSIYKPIIHFEAPPSSKVEKEMNRFMQWFSDTGPEGTNPTPGLTRAGIAHLYFESIHPFEDGNGRIGRAISEKALAQHLGQPTLIALAFTIERKRKDYYQALIQVNKSNKITDWLIYFSKVVLEATDNTQKRIEFLIEKAKLFERLKEKINKRQEKVLIRMFKEGPEGFKGGLSAENYINISKATRPTATRDLQDLVEKGALTKKGERKYTRYFLNIFQ
ncbi:MAG TPA: Fic family protein [Bdellovibrionota bacterium]|nr:Fic family protein [Bdellovibrionota bacterium]